MRILALTRYGRSGASSRVRIFQYREPLASLGIEVEISTLFEDGYVEALYARTSRVSAVFTAYVRRLRRLTGTRNFDALWVEKEMLPWLPSLFELALLPRNLPLVLDYDDAVFHRYDMHRWSWVRAMLGDKLDRLMGRSTLVMAGNEYLAHRARAAGAGRVEVVPTVVDLKRYAPRRPDTTKLPTIGWIGSPSTAVYLESVRTVVGEIVDEGLARAVAIGARSDQLAGGPFDAIRWSEETEVAQLAGCDLGIMPLEDTLWERGKCGYKLIQYMALGLPVVASPIGVNNEIVAEDNGFLARTVPEWRHALRLLATDGRRRAELGAAGRRKVEMGYSLDVWAPRVADLLRDAA